MKKKDIVTLLFGIALLLLFSTESGRNIIFTLGDMFSKWFVDSFVSNLGEGL